jgi:hypothetical protein
VPSYRVSPRYVEQVNITHVTNITNITTIVNNPQVAVRDMDFANRKFHHAVTTVPEAVMTGRGNVAPAAAQWRAANPGRAGNEGGEDRIERGGRRAEPGRNVAASPPVMTMAAPPVASPVMAPTMSAPPVAPQSMSRPAVRANQEVAPVLRAPVERQGRVRERADDRDGDRPSRVAPAAVTPPAVMNAPATAPVGVARPAAGPVAAPRFEPRATPPAVAAPAAPMAAPRMEGPRAPTREAAPVEGRKQSQDEKADGRRNNNAPRAVE